MKLRIILSSAAATGMVAVASFSFAAESSSAEEAKDLLNKAVSYVEKERPARAFCAFNDPSGAFHKGPLYVFVINMDGAHFAHSPAPSLIGTSLRETRDAARQPPAQAIMEVIGSQSERSVEYLCLNDRTHSVA